MTQAERLKWFKTATEQEIGEYFAGRQLKQVVRDYAVASDSVDKDALAELRVGLMMPTLKAMALDNAKAEQEAMGSFSSEEDDNELKRGECSGNYGHTSFEQSIVASAKASADYWKKVRQVKPSASYQAVQERGIRKAAKATDSTFRSRKNYASYVGSYSV